MDRTAATLCVFITWVGVATCLHLHSPQPFSAEAECRCLPSTHHCRLEVLALSVVSAYSPGIPACMAGFRLCCNRESPESPAQNPVITDARGNMLVKMPPNYRHRTHVKNPGHKVLEDTTVPKEETGGVPGTADEGTQEETSQDEPSAGEEEMAKSKEDGNSRTGIHDLKHLSKIDIEAGSGDEMVGEKSDDMAMDVEVSHIAEKALEESLESGNSHGSSVVEGEILEAFRNATKDSEHLQGLDKLQESSGGGRAHEYKDETKKTVGFEIDQASDERMGGFVDGTHRQKGDTIFAFTTPSFPDTLEAPEVDYRFSGHTPSIDMPEATSPAPIITLVAPELHFNKDDGSVPQSENDDKQQKDSAVQDEDFSSSSARDNLESLTTLGTDVNTFSSDRQEFSFILQGPEENKAHRTTICPSLPCDTPGIRTVTTKTPQDLYMDTSDVTETANLAPGKEAASTPPPVVIPKTLPPLHLNSEEELRAFLLSLETLPKAGTSSAPQGDVLLDVKDLNQGKSTSYLSWLWG
ncbi:hypothetical protein C7M84_018810 [Penaeus vannamei]|uniref:Uncharacterized protein n=1 Tax=Penaeus vannamei TaxID=6689 RepID=A0A3R7PEL3_PENVA|nr:hypothetical protein C7M84_018810 [Penaeus vannamei]